MLHKAETNKQTVATKQHILLHLDNETNEHRGTKIVNKVEDNPNKKRSISICLPERDFIDSFKY